jgi:hypothetical protein
MKRRTPKLVNRANRNAKDLPGVGKVLLDKFFQSHYISRCRYRLNLAMGVAGNIESICSKKQNAYRNTQETQCVIYV